MDYLKRKIIHVDMDAFFAAVEQRDHPEFRGRPVVVGGTRERGVVCSASYEARKFGIHSAMPTAVAARKCPHLLFARPRFDAYKEASDQMDDIFHRFSDVVQGMSIDEAYLDVTENKVNMTSATKIAREIKQAIRRETRLTASAGVSYCKFLAKIASDWDKPDGLFVIRPEEAEAFLEKLPIDKFRGIGKSTSNYLKSHGILTGMDLKKLDRFEIARLMGKAGPYYYNIVRGIDRSQVRTHHIRKSVGAERTFNVNLSDDTSMLERLRKISEHIAKRLEKAKTTGSTVTLKIKYDNFQRSTRSKTLHHYVGKNDELFAIATELLHTPHLPERPVRLLGLSISNLSSVRERYTRDQLVLSI